MPPAVDDRPDEDAEIEAAGAPQRIRFEHLDAPVLGIGTATPRISWQVPTAPPRWRQGAYEVEVSRADGAAETCLAESSEQVLVPWPVAPLASRESVGVRLRVRGADARWSEWSERASVEAGLLEVAEWTAVCISPADAAGAAPTLGTTFEVDADVVSARLYITALGLYRARLNGERVGRDELAPGWTAYNARLGYQTFDVTAQLRSGVNDLDVTLGNGWWRGRIGYERARAKYGSELGLLAQLDVVTTAGRQVIATGEGWRAGRSGIVADDLFDGQVTDLTAAPAALVDPVAPVSLDAAKLIAPTGPPIRATEIVAPVELSCPRPGVTRIDFGQNLVGWVRITLRGAHGGEVEVRHAEVLEHGELGVRPLRTAKATDRYIVPDDGRDHLLEPCFTFHGFRYAEVSGVSGLQAADVEAVVVHSDMRRTGWFDSSDELLNQLHHNVVWSTRGNFVGLPTDCPQRDERLGWTGDVQVFAPTAAYLFDCSGLLQSWLADLTAEQYADGTVPWVVPDILHDLSPPTAAWGDAAVVVPWVLYRATGDVEILREQYDSMRRWVDRITREAGDDLVWTGGFQFGDWLDPAAPPDNPFLARADADIVATACLARCAGIVADTADVLGDGADVARYRRLAQRVRAAFRDRYVTPQGRIVSDCVTTYAMALEWDLIEDPTVRAAAGRRLADLVRAGDYRVSTGFVGTPLVTDALTAAGYPEVAYRLLLQTECPSWLYPVTMGATTIWERWDSMLPDGTINPGQMTSFNHYALGAVADWLHRGAAGLDIGAAGYRELTIRPHPTRQLDRAVATHHGPYGPIRAGWHRHDGGVAIVADVPVGSTALVWLPGADQPVPVAHGSHRWDVDDPCPPAPQLDTIADVIDDRDVWARVVQVVTAAGFVGGAAELATRVGRFLDAPVTELALRVAPPFRADFAEQLRPDLDAAIAAARDTSLNDAGAPGAGRRVTSARPPEPQAPTC